MGNILISRIFFRCTSPTDQQYDQKNIRRRVYDALNVLMAMNIISKEKKEIRWLGLPTNSIQEANGLELDKAKRIDRIKAKTQQLQDLILQVCTNGFSFLKSFGGYVYLEIFWTFGEFILQRKVTNVVSCNCINVEE